MHRRAFLHTALAMGASLYSHRIFGTVLSLADWREQGMHTFKRHLRFDLARPISSRAEVIKMHQFMELDASREHGTFLAERLLMQPWRIMADGACDAPGVISVEDILQNHTLEERVYRKHCVRGWVADIPWVGVPLNAVIERFKPNADARFVAFQSIFDQHYPAHNDGFRPPYTEGLRLDEAMHPLTFLAVGAYGETLTPEQGAPIRLVVPWKYGYKSIKSLVAIHFQAARPDTTWQQLYGEDWFTGNVGAGAPFLASGRSARQIGQGSFFRPIHVPTERFNGYGSEVAHLYRTRDSL